MEVTGTAIRGNNIALVANIDGEHDKTGLPTPTHSDLLLLGQQIGSSNSSFCATKNQPANRPRAQRIPYRLTFTAKNNHDVHGMLACFAEGAVVVDEGHERRGRSAIREWIESPPRDTG